MKITRCYRYALAPTPAQKDAILAAAMTARRHWNALVACQRYAEHEIHHGRHGSIKARLTELMIAKNAVGMAMPKAQGRAAKDGVTVDEALRLNRIDQARDAAKFIRHSKNGRFLRRMSCRQLAVTYAIESAEATRKSKGTCGSPIGASLNKKFADSCALYISGTRGAPKFKSNARGDSISLQWQITELAPSPIIGDRVNIAKILGTKEPVLVPAIFHRPIPDGAVIKQVALTLRGDRMFVVFMLDMESMRSYVTTGQTLGIDPGRKMALSASNTDGTVTEAFQPPIARDKHFLKRLRRLQRKADRQLRVANPECFNADGTFKRGFRPKVKSKNFFRTGQKILRIQEHIANARLDYYHNTANRVLHQNDVIGIGTWRGNGNGLGIGKSKRAQNRKDYDHAISSFAAILHYKAAESGNRTVVDVPEFKTTKTCSACHAETGPTGVDNLDVREWTCSACGAEHDRDFQAARNIAFRAQEMTTGSAAGVVAPTRRKKGRHAKAKRRSVSPQRDGESPAPTKTTMSRQCESRSGDPETGNGPVIERRSNTVLSGHSRQTGENRIPLAESMTPTDNDNDLQVDCRSG